MAELMGPYDPASPCLTTFCQRISVAEHDRLASDYTQKALAELINYLEYNPTAYHNILRKRKREDAENSGVFSWLKVKVLSSVYGDEHVEKLDDGEAKMKLSSLKNDIMSSYNYSEEAKGSGKRFSRRIANRNNISTKTVAQKNHEKSNDCIIKNLENELDAVNQSVSNFATPIQFVSKPDKRAAFIPEPPPPPPLLPPPPPPPPVSFPTKSHSTDAKMVSSYKQSQSQTNLKTKVGPVTRSRMVATDPTRSNSDATADDLIAMLKNPNIRATLKPVGNSDFTPYQRQQQKKNSATNKENDFPLFNQQLISKFLNARSPKSPEGTEFLSDVSSPDSFACSP